jgi:hypothetical protein
MKKLLRLIKEKPASFITIILAIVIAVLNTLNIAVNLFSPVTLAVLALLAWSLLDLSRQLDDYKQKIDSSKINVLRTRSELPDVEIQAQEAMEIDLCAISGYNLLNQHKSFLEKKLIQGCNLKIILVDPNSTSLDTYGLQCDPPLQVARGDIQSSIEISKELVNFSSKTKGKCEVRFLNVFLPFSIFAVDVRKPTGTMIVEYHTYKKPIGDRMHIFLTNEENSRWFSYYKNQIELIWINSRPLISQSLPTKK